MIPTIPNEIPNFAVLKREGARGWVGRKMTTVLKEYFNSQFKNHEFSREVYIYKLLLFLYLTSKVNFAALSQSCLFKCSSQIVV